MFPECARFRGFHCIILLLLGSTIACNAATLHHEALSAYTFVFVTATLSLVTPLIITITTIPYVPSLYTVFLTTIAPLVCPCIIVVYTVYCISVAAA